MCNFFLTLNLAACFATLHLMLQLLTKFILFYFSGGYGRTVGGEGEEVGQSQVLFFSKLLKLGQHWL